MGHFPQLVHLVLVTRIFRLYSLLRCSEMREARPHKRMFNNDSRHTAGDGELWLTGIKVQAQHLPKRWQAPIHQEPNKG
jgi:hypothetical protein